MAKLDGSDAMIINRVKEDQEPEFYGHQEPTETPVIFDGRNLFDPSLVRSNGFDYFAIGR